jgi:hypothetical protein
MAWTAVTDQMCPPFALSRSIHVYLAVRELYVGLALRHLMQYVAYQAIPADCPECGHRLRPASAPDVPWLQSVSSIRVPRPRLRLRAPAWRTPTWLRRGDHGQASPLFVSDQEEGHDEERYRDEPGPVEDPPEVEVVGRRDRKARSGSGVADEGEQWQS